MAEQVETVVVGAGQAGLALSFCLTRLGHEHLLLDRGRIAERWRSERWDSFTLLSPNWHTRLPAHCYDGPNPDGFMTREEIVHYFESYAAKFGPPVRTGATATAVQPLASGRWRVEVNGEDAIDAANVVIAIGGFQAPHVPSLAAALPVSLFQIHTVKYRNSAQLPPGGVLVVGSGTSGQQIAEELCQAGRPVWIAVGHHAKLPRRYRGRDAVWWMDATGSFDQIVDGAPQEAHRPGAALSGSGGGHDLDLRAFARDGVALVGHLCGVEGTTLTLTDDVEESLTVAERVEAAFKHDVDEYIDQNRLEAPAEELSDEAEALRRVRIVSPTTLNLRAAGITTVIWCTGFRPDLDWIHAPVLDAKGQPVHRRGVTEHRGLYFLGLQWLYKRKSSFIDGAAEDAEHVAKYIAATG